MKTTLIKPTVGQLVAEIRAKQLDVITDMLGWSPEQYCEHQLDEYDNFLHRLFYGFPIAMLEEVKYSPIMSGFWKNEWMLRNDQDFLPFAKQILFEGYEVNDKGALIKVVASDADRSAVYDEYLYLHSFRRLINEDNFMAQYNRVLEMIRRENSK